MPFNLNCQKEKDYPLNLLLHLSQTKIVFSLSSITIFQERKVIPFRLRLSKRERKSFHSFTTSFLWKPHSLSHLTEERYHSCLNLSGKGSLTYLSKERYYFLTLPFPGRKELLLSGNVIYPGERLSFQPETSSGRGRGYTFSHM